MTKEPEIDLDIDKNLKGILTITCPQCKRKTKKRLDELSSGKEVKCFCGASFKFTGDDLRSLQRSFDELKRSLDHLDRSFKNFGK